MSTTQIFHTTVPESGTITLPPEFCGNPVNVIMRKKNDTLQPGCDADFWRLKPLEEIDAEQGGPKICTNPDDYFGWMADFWESKEEMEEFLRRRKEEI